MDFSADGSKLASVSTSPDYMLTVWDWMEESMGLHSKAFGQDVWNVKFSVDDSRRLTTSGIGHIRFWKMAATFTGLKLQGSIGKFGKVDLSDIEHFVELPDGKVISGTENGSLLLWEGNFIKCRFVQVGNKPCHNGSITYLFHDRQEKCIVSSSTDGWIRWWDYSAIDSAEVDSDHSMDFPLLPLAEYQYPGTIGIKGLIDCGFRNDSRRFVVIDANGSSNLMTFRWKSGEQFNLCDSLIRTKDGDANFTISLQSFQSFHSGSITGLDTCPIDHLVATCGDDGNVFCVDYRNRRIVARASNSSSATCLKWLPLSLSRKGNAFAVGFAEGAVKIYGLSSDQSGEFVLTRILAFKPHNLRISDVSFSDDGTFFATSSIEGSVFFFKCSADGDSSFSWEPLCFVDLTKSFGTKVFGERLMWSSDGAKLLVSCSDGNVRELALDNLASFVNDTVERTTFETTFLWKEITPTIPVLSNSKSGYLEICDLKKLNEKPQNAESQEETNKSSQAAAMVQSEISKVPLKISCIAYSCRNTDSAFVVGGSINAAQQLCCEYKLSDDLTVLPIGLYSSDGKDFLKTPQVSTLRYSWTKKFLSLGLADGSVLLKPSNYLEVYARCIGHSFSVSSTAFSHDDEFVISAGKDGCLVVYRLRQDLINDRSLNLFKDLEADIFHGEIFKDRSKDRSDPAYLSFVSSKQFPEESLFRKISTKSPVLDSSLVSLSEVPDLPLNAYSIQDNRLRLEEDAKKSAAEDLKDRIVASIKALRKDYEKIIAENETIPEAVRLVEEELLVDGNFFELTNTLFQKALQEVHLENSYSAEKTEKLLEKMKMRLMNGLLMEEIPLSTFQYPLDSRASDLQKSLTPCIVWSFRIAALDPNVKEIISQVKSQVRLEELKESQQRSNDLAQKKALTAMDEMKSRLQKKDDNLDKPDHLSVKEKIGNLNIVNGQDNEKPESTAIQRRSKRKERKEELKNHETQKPNEHEDDSRDIESIRTAEKTIGDYKLKSADDYEVPEEQRINALKKMRQMAMLEDSMALIRLAFNEKFLQLRALKRDIVFNILKNNRRIREIDAELNQSHLSNELWEPALDPSEFPDDYDEMTSEELQSFISSSKDISWEKLPSHQVPMHKTVTGGKLSITKNLKTGAFEVVRADKAITSVLLTEPSDQTLSSLIRADSGVSADSEALGASRSKYYEVDEGLVHSMFPQIDFLLKSKTMRTSTKQVLESSVPILQFTKSLIKQRMTVSNPSRSQSKLIEQRRIKLQFERAMIQNDIESTVTFFHEAVDDLRIQRHQITSDLKLAEFRLLTLYQEYLLLQTFEAKDNLLQQKQIKNKNDEKDNYSLIYENKMKLESKLEEIQHWNEKLSSITNELKAVLPESHPYYDILSKIFRKKVKRNKNADDEDDDANEDDDESDDAEDDGEDDELEEIEDICPPGCDQIIFEKILDLREKKLDTEEVSSEINKNIEDLKRTNERLKQREKQIAKETQQTEYEVTQFQLQKQAALNQIKVIVPLRLSQIFAFESSGDLSGPDNNERAKSDEIKESEQEKLNNGQMEKRCLVANVKMKTHSLFSTRYV